MPQVYRSLGRDDDAVAAERRGIELAERRLALEPGDIRALVLGSSILVALGREEQGLDWTRRALELAPKETMVLYNVACTYAVLGRVEEALDHLEAAVDVGYRQRAWLETNSELESLRGHPR